MTSCSLSCANYRCTPYIFKIRRKKFTPAGAFSKESCGKLRCWRIFEESYGKLSGDHFRRRTFTFLARKAKSRSFGFAQDDRQERVVGAQYPGAIDLLRTDSDCHRSVSHESHFSPVLWALG